MTVAELIAQLQSLPNPDALVWAEDSDGLWCVESVNYLGATNPPTTLNVDVVVLA